MDKIDHLINKNVEKIYPSKEFLKAKLATKKPLTIYLGVDPSSSEIHLGHTILLRKLKEFQELGHKVIFLIGDFTGMVGDPTGKDKARVALTHEQVLENSKTYQKQVEKFISFSGKNPAEIRYNNTWLAKMNLEEVINLSSRLTVQQLLERDMFQERLKAGRPIYLNEFLYPLLQGFDSVAMRVDGEIGGSDQTFNMLVGRELEKEILAKEKFVLTTPLLLGLDGAKMSKSANNTIPITTTSEDMFGKVMSVRDGLIIDYFRFLTEKPETEVVLLEKDLKNKKVNPREVKASLAKAIVASFFNEEAGEKAEAEFNKVFSKKQEPSRIPTVTKDFPGDVTTLDLVKLTNLASSSSAATRLIEQGGVEVDGVVRRHPKEIISIKGSQTKIKIGKRSFLEIVWRKNS